VFATRSEAEAFQAQEQTRVDEQDATLIDNFHFHLQGQQSLVSIVSIDDLLKKRLSNSTHLLVTFVVAGLWLMRKWMQSRKVLQLKVKLLCE